MVSYSYLEANADKTGRWGLILVVMEDGLVLRRNYNRGLDARHRVLILIVVEDGLVLWFSKMSSSMERCLNPYCSGRWSRTKGVVFMSKVLPVLILIVVEDGLVLCLWVQQSM